MLIDFPFEKLTPRWVGLEMTTVVTSRVNPSLNFRSFCKANFNSLIEWMVSSYKPIYCSNALSISFIFNDGVHDVYSVDPYLIV